MKITNLDNIPKTKVDMEGAKDAYKQVPISKTDGSSLFSFRVFTIEPKGYTPFHTHPFEHLNYIIDGHGTQLSHFLRGVNLGKLGLRAVSG